MVGWTIVRKTANGSSALWRQNVLWLFGVERGSWGESSADEEHAESVVVAVAEAARDAAVELDQSVDGFGAAVGCSAGVVVSQQGRGAVAAHGTAGAWRAGCRCPECREYHEGTRT